MVTLLPAHSECYEESLITALIEGPKTFEEIEKLFPSSVTSRTIKRLIKAGLVATPLERDYVFFFKSKRDPSQEIFKPTERKVYEAIHNEGVSAKKLAKQTGLSMRRVYKYLRGLKGKKLIFTRKNPKMYGLTVNGEKLAVVLQELTELVDETWDSSKQVAGSLNS